MSFETNEKLRKIIFNEGRETILKELLNSFYINSISEVVIPSTMKGITVDGFHGWSKLTTIDLSSCNNMILLTKNLFKGCTNLATINLPSSLEKIDTNAFEESGLKELDLSKTKITLISDHCFQRCKQLRNIYLPSTVALIGESAFQMSGLKEIDLSKTQITSISDFCFRFCEKLESVQLPSTIRSIDKNAFENCFELKNINLPSSLTTIHFKAFKNCRSLKEVTIPSTLNQFQAGIFTGCSNLTLKIPIHLKELITNYDILAYTLRENIRKTDPAEAARLDTVFPITPFTYGVKNVVYF